MPRPSPAFRLLVPLLLVTLAMPALAGPPGAGRGGYFPPPGAWEHRDPQAMGMRPEQLAEAVSFARENESKAPRNLEVAHYQTFGREPFGEAAGPFKERGEPTGLVIRGGYIVAQWGDPSRVDMTFSVSKSFLSSVVGAAIDRGLIRSLDEPVAASVGPILTLGPGGAAVRSSAERLGEQRLLTPFASAHNRTVTWEHLLRQTSDWEGTLWGKPEWADRPTGQPSEWATRPRKAPGTAYEYNDVRVNALALAATSIWRRPLPQVLHEFVMEPIGASSTWGWYGYDTSWIVLEGQAVQVVSGGGHWGGGMFIHAYDLARFGLLSLRRGKWKDRQVLSEAWVKRALTPTGPEPTYGFMNWFLNTDRKLWPSAPASAFAHVGNGTNIVYVDPENDLVVVARWIDNKAVDGLLQRVLASLQRPTGTGAKTVAR
jgi:CubicO group peptidase (beta-lactamase class C family)